MNFKRSSVVTPREIKRENSLSIDKRVGEKEDS